VIWGMGDDALLPVQIDGLGEFVPRLTVERIEGAGHFVPWEDAPAVIAAMRRWGV
jgi:pimeloyl-ACP methyl ester carboxylesterase